MKIFFAAVKQVRHPVSLGKIVISVSLMVAFGLWPSATKSSLGESGELCGACHSGRGGSV